MKGSVVIHVIDPRDESAVSGVTVRLTMPDGGEPARSQTTDASGLVGFERLAAGTWRASVTMAAGDEPNALTIVVADFEHADVTMPVRRADPRDQVPPRGDGLPATTRWATTRPSPAASPEPVRGRGWVRGRAVDRRTGEAVPDATVMIDSGPSPAPDIAMLTDGEGAFLLGSLGPGTWVVRVIAGDGREGRSTVDVAAGAESTATVYLRIAARGS